MEIPYKYRDSNVTSWADEAVIEASRRARLLLDNSSTVSLVSGTAEYDLPTNAIFIRRAKIVGEESALTTSSYRILDEDVSGWESHSGVPTDYFTDMTTDKFSVYPNPDQNYTLSLMTVREPVLGETIDIPTRFHYALVDWMLFRAYSVRRAYGENNADSGDIDIANYKVVEVREKAQQHYALFIDEFGERSSAKDEVFQLRNRPFSGDDGTY